MAIEDGVYNVRVWQHVGVLVDARCAWWGGMWQAYFGGGADRAFIVAAGHVICIHDVGRRTHNTVVAPSISNRYSIVSHLCGPVLSHAAGSWRHLKEGDE